MQRQPPLPLAEPKGPPKRYSSRPLPLYRHVPGLTPHPVKDPRGHLHGHVEEGPSKSCRELPEGWPECAEYLYGIDQFNRAYLWEAHEVWELIWIAAGKTTEPAGFVQGLIQVSAALLRAHLGTPRGGQALVTKAWKNFERAQRGAGAKGRLDYMGIELEPWKLAVEAYLQGGGRFPFLILQAAPSLMSIAESS